jgi:hypothetical protein
LIRAQWQIGGIIVHPINREARIHHMPASSGHAATHSASMVKLASRTQV